jgi:hypothetical protein
MKLHIAESLHECLRTPFQRSLEGGSITQLSYRRQDRELLTLDPLP